MDEKTALDSTITVSENGAQTKLRTVGDKWSYLQRVKFGANAQPFYVLLAFDESVDAYMAFLRQGLDTYAKRSAQ